MIKNSISWFSFRRFFFSRRPSSACLLQSSKRNSLPTRSHDPNNAIRKSSSSTTTTTATATATTITNNYYPKDAAPPWRSTKNVPKGFWTDPNNRKLFFEWATRELRIPSREHDCKSFAEGWYKISTKDLARLGGGGFMNSYYGESIYRALTDLYPDIEWLPWRFSKSGAPSGFWQDHNNHVRFFRWAEQQLGIENPTDWFKFTLDDIRRLGGYSLVNNYYGGSLERFLTAMYANMQPKEEIEWLPWLFTNRNHMALGCWSDPRNRRRFFDWAAQQLGVRPDVPDDWYRVTREDITRLGGGGLINAYFKGSFTAALAAVYPEHDFLPWRFPSGVPQGFWKNNPSNHRRFFDWAAKELQVHRMPDDWYRVSKEDIDRIGGAGLLRVCYNTSLSRALESIYPELQWEPWRFASVPNHFWKQLANQRRFFDWAAVQLGISSNSSSSSTKNNHEGWYNVTGAEVGQLGGTGLLQSRYGGSLAKALAAVYPEIEWQPWRFRGFDAEEHRRLTASNNNGNGNSKGNDNGNGNGTGDLVKKQFVTYLQRELAISGMDDWYRVSMEQIRQLGGHNFVMQYGGLCAFLKNVFPEHDWDEQRFRREQVRGKKASQRWLKVALRKCFPTAEIVEEYTHPNLVFTSTGGSTDSITLDLWIPSLSLAFEYQGQHHFHDINHFGGSNAKQKQQERDADKHEACKRVGITLVAIPYWWDRTPESIAATVCKLLPELAVREEGSHLAELASRGTSIPSSPPPSTRHNS